MHEKSPKIIVIDHDVFSRNFTLDCLQSQGYDTISSENGIMGLELIKQYLPDLVISALMIPDIDGYAVLSTIREDSLTAITPFIFLTAINTKESLRKAMEV
ncbi:MAG: PleD family two-component system response regulator, partial [Dolichospermum sp.]